MQKQETNEEKLLHIIYKLEKSSTLSDNEKDRLQEEINDLLSEASGVDLSDNQALNAAAQIPDEALALSLVNSFIEYENVDLMQDLNTQHHSVGQLFAKNQREWLQFMQDWLRLHPAENVLDDPRFSAIHVTFDNADLPDPNSFLFSQFVVQNMSSICRKKIQYDGLSFALYNVTHDEENRHHLLLFYFYGILVGCMTWESNPGKACDTIGFFCSTEGYGTAQFRAYLAIAGNPSCITLKAISPAIGFWSRLGFRHISRCDEAEPPALAEYRRQVEASRSGYKTVDKNYYRLLSAFGDDAAGYAMTWCAEQELPNFERKRLKSE